jgi:hypothetical protein
MHESGLARISSHFVKVKYRLLTFTSLLLKPNSQKKHGCVRPNTILPVMLSVGVHRGSLPKLDIPAKSMKVGNKQSLSWRERDPKTASFIQAEPSAPTSPASS